MKKPFFWEKAKKVLKTKDEKLGKIISNYPKDFLFSRSDPFYTLARSIVGQQISVQAAQAVWERYEKKIKQVEEQRSRRSLPRFLFGKGCNVVWTFVTTGFFIDNCSISVESRCFRVQRMPK